MADNDQQGPVRRWAALIVAAMLTGIIAILVALFLQRSNEPSLSINTAYSVGVTVPYPKDGGDFVHAVIDFLDGSVLFDNEFLVSGNSDGAIELEPNFHSYAGKLLIKNTGGSAATNVRIVFGYRYAVNFQVSSPNVNAELTNNYDQDSASGISASGMALRAFISEINIDNLPKDGNAFITLSWITNSSTLDFLDQVPYLL